MKYRILHGHTVIKAGDLFCDCDTFDNGSFVSEEFDDYHEARFSAPADWRCRYKQDDDKFIIDEYMVVILETVGNHTDYFVNWSDLLMDETSWKEKEVVENAYYAKYRR